MRRAQVTAFVNCAKMGQTIMRLQSFSLQRSRIQAYLDGCRNYAAQLRVCNGFCDGASNTALVHRCSVVARAHMYSIYKCCNQRH